MRNIKWMLPLLLAAIVIASGLGFVTYYNNYEGPGEHWAPQSPIAHEIAQFSTDMGAEGDYLVHIEKLSSKLPLLFVEYQTPGPVLDMTIHSDDGIVRLNQQFADEGAYRISVQHTIHPDHKEVIDFTVQTPLAKYANDLLLLLFLLFAGLISGKRLRALALGTLCLIASSLMLSAPDDALAHNIGGEHQTTTIGSRADDVQLTWLRGQAPEGEANRTPIDWSMQLTRAGRPVRRAAYELDFIHLESGFPVLHAEGVTTGNGAIHLKYSPPDGTEYRLQLRAVIDGRVRHLALEGEAQPIRPTAGRKWSSFLLMMVPLLLGMIWGWRREGADAS